MAHLLQSLDYAVPELRNVTTVTLGNVDHIRNSLKSGATDIHATAASHGVLSKTRIPDTNGTIEPFGHNRYIRQNPVIVTIVTHGIAPTDGLIGNPCVQPTIHHMYHTTYNRKSKK